MHLAETVDYLAVGHVCRDVSPAGFTTGGTAAYAGRVAQALGCRTAILTSAPPAERWDAALDQLRVHRVPAAATTTFENIYEPGGRRQVIHAVASPITSADVPPAWQRAKIVHLGPIANEIDPEMIRLFSGSIVGLTPQGWMRRWDEHGRVEAVDWPAARAILPLATAVILSREDLLDEDMLAEYRQLAPLLVLTLGAGGCTVFYRGEARHFEAIQVHQTEATGAGDIFAAAFLIQLLRTAGNAWEAARFANRLAGASVTRHTLEGKISQVRELEYERQL